MLVFPSNESRGNEKQKRMITEYGFKQFCFVVDMLKSNFLIYNFATMNTFHARFHPQLICLYSKKKRNKRKKEKNNMN